MISITITFASQGPAPAPDKVQADLPAISHKTQNSHESKDRLLYLDN